MKPGSAVDVAYVTDLSTEYLSPTPQKNYSFRLWFSVKIIVEPANQWLRQILSGTSHIGCSIGRRQ